MSKLHKKIIDDTSPQYEGQKPDYFTWEEAEVNIGKGKKRKTLSGKGNPIKYLQPHYRKKGSNFVMKK